MRALSPRVVLENLAWLIGSLLLAIFVWISATVEQNPVQVSRFPQRVPIQIETDEGMIVTNSPITSAQVVLRAEASVWETLETQDINIVADLRGKSPGTYVAELQIDVATSRRVVVEDFQPRQITVAIDQAAEALIPVEIEMRNNPPTGFEVTETTFDTPEVRITGPAGAVSRVVAAQASVNLLNERNPLTRTDVRLLPVDAQGQIISGVQLAPETVDISIDIQPGADFREVFVTPNIVGEPSPGYVIYSITYDPQTILVSGRPSALEQLPGTIQTSALYLTGRTESFTQTLSVELPEDVFLPTEQNVTVTVQIDALTASRRFDHLPVQVQGLGAGLQASVAPSEVTMLITGPQPVLDTLTPGNISILADLSNLAPGNHQVQLNAVVNREGLSNAVISVLPAILEVQITPNAAPPTQTPQAPPALTPRPGG